MKIYASLVGSIAIIIGFFLMGTATSMPIYSFDASVDTLGTNLILTNNTKDDIENGWLSLTHVDSLARDTNQYAPLYKTPNGDFLKWYNLDKYQLAAGQTDTIPFSAFMSYDKLTYPNEIEPYQFRLEFLNNKRSRKSGRYLFVHIWETKKEP